MSWLDFNVSNKSAADGIHAALAGGVWQGVVFGFAGIGLHDNQVLSLSPRLPQHWEKVSFFLHWWGDVLHFDVTHDKVEVHLSIAKSKKTDTELLPRWIEIEGQRVQLEANQPVRVSVNRG